MLAIDAMSRMHVHLGGAGAAAMDSYTLGDVLVCKAHRGKFQEVAHLLDELNADINYQNQHGCTALHGAAASGQLSTVQMILERTSVNTSIVDDDEQTALHYAAFYGHLEVVQLLVEHGVPLDIPDKYGRLAHCSAAINGHLDVVTFLLEECPNPIDINAIDEYGSTCLHWAALKGRMEVVRYLCMKGIDVHVTSFDNKTAYQLAKDKQKHKCVLFLKNWYETTQKFVHAAEVGDDEELRGMITEINREYPLRFMRDKNGKNAMHWAAECGHLSTLKLLGENFAVWTDADKFGRNALHCAALGGHRDCAFWLIRNAKDAAQFMSLTLTSKSPSRCAFEAGHSALASRLQAWEEGNDEYAKYESESTQFSSEFSEEETKPQATTTRGRDFDSVRNWLKSLNMDEYTKNFEKDGFDTLRGVATIDEDDLIDMRVKKGHRRVVLTHIEELRSQLAILDELALSAGREPEWSPSLEMVMQAVRNINTVQATATTQLPTPAPAPGVAPAPLASPPVSAPVVDGAAAVVAPAAVPAPASTAQPAPAEVAPATPAEAAPVTPVQPTEAAPATPMQATATTPAAPVQATATAPATPVQATEAVSAPVADSGRVSPTPAALPATVEASAAPAEPATVSAATEPEATQTAPVPTPQPVVPEPAPAPEVTAPASPVVPEPTQSCPAPETPPVVTLAQAAPAAPVEESASDAAPAVAPAPVRASEPAPAAPTSIESSPLDPASARSD